MRFSYVESMTNPAFYAPLAQAAEEAGFHSFMVPDSVAYPEVSDSIYPFNPDGSREFLEDKPFIDPFVLCASLAAVTTTLRFATFVIKLPIRHPVLVAKQAASVAALSNNRLTMGVGVSPWPEDYELTGTPWHDRGRRMDESLEVISGLLAGGFYEHHGEIYDVVSIKMSPTPTEPIPILVGGHSNAALRRAARHDGWMHGGGDLDELPGLIEKLHRFREETGRSEENFQIHVISLDVFSRDGIKRLEDAGVTDVVVGLRYPYEVGPDTEPLAPKIDALRQYADNIIHRLD